uniref:FLYWCH-type domain-containing protein n=1 Tax=Trichuris muris TaxID=70415 RepID=A0A5S6QFP8_TRIMR
MADVLLISQRQRPKFVHDGHMYTFEALDCTGMIKFRRCDKRYEYGYKARIHTSVETNEVVKTVNFHCRGGDAARVCIAAVCTAVKSRAENALETPAMILNDTYQSVSSDVRAQMPSTKATKETIQRRMCDVSAATSQPANRASIVIPEAYQTYGGQEQFLLYDSGLGDDDRLLIFGRHSYMAWSAHIKHLYADGTFKITPPLFAQVYILMAERDGFVLPVLYALLPDKQETTYRRMFEAVKEM